jgi:hypothetical protein
VVLPALFLAAAPLAAQSGNGASSTDTTQQSGSAQARIDAAMTAATRANIPTSLLESKVAEGQAKQVPLPRIATAVEARLASLQRASVLMQGAGIENRSAAELLIAGDAMQSGVRDSAVVQVYRNATPGRRVVAMAVLADLVRLGASSDVAFDRVNATLSSTSALANLQAEVASQLRLSGLTSTLDAAGGIGVGGTLRIP